MVRRARGETASSGAQQDAGAAGAVNLDRAPCIPRGATARRRDAIPLAPLGNCLSRFKDDATPA